MNKFDIKDWVDKLIYSIYNQIASVIYFFSTNTKKVLSRNLRYKDCHKGGRCFILGTGPSLKTLDSNQISKLKSETVFGLNSLYKSEVGRELTPSYYALLDNNYWEGFEHTFVDIVDLYKSSPPVFITDIRARKIIDERIKGFENIYIYSKKYPVNKVDSELDNGIYALMNVVSYCIVSAIYMGFKEIYLLGCDYNAFCNFGRGHCYDDDKEMEDVSYNLSFYLKYYHITTEFHYLISKLAKEKGIKIINLTEVSLLDAYPRDPVSSVL